MKYCENCGKELSEGSNYCPNCGAKVSELEDDLDRKLKEKQLENEKSKSGCLNMLTGSFISLVMLFTIGPVVAGINFLIWLIAWLVVTLREGREK